MKHKHAVEIIAWANGAEIEGRSPGGEWKLTVPNWYLYCEYRVKPEKKPDVVRYISVYPEGGIEPPDPCICLAGVIRIIINGETGKLSAEVVE